MTRLALAFVAVPTKLTAIDHLRRLESSALYRRREIEAEQSKQLSRVQALLYLSEDYYERYPDRTVAGNGRRQ